MMDGYQKFMFINFFHIFFFIFISEFDGFFRCSEMKSFSNFAGWILFFFLMMIDS